MRHNPYLSIIMCIIFSLCSVDSFAHLDTTKKIKSASEYDYPPFCIVYEDGSVDGFSVELLTAALREVGLDVDFKPGQWSEIKDELKAGKIQVLPLVGRTPEREEIFDFTFTYLTVHGAIFVRKGDDRITTEDDLADKEIIVMQGDNAEEYVNREGVSPHIITVETYEKAMRLLEAGKYDAVIAQRLMGIQLLKNLGITEVVPLDQRLDKFRQDFSFAVREGDAELLALLNEGLSIVISDGTYERLYEKWFAPIVGHQLTTRDLLEYALIFGVPISFVILISFVLLLRIEVKRKTKGLQHEIEERKQAEQQVKTSLREKEILLRELHHRVKNNMQVVSSLLSLQGRYIEDSRYVELLNDSKNRIRSMSLVHEQLYQSRNMVNINFNDYISTLAKTIHSYYVTKANEVSMEIDVEDIVLGIDTAIPCGLLVNEILSNCMKHAFPEGEKGKVKIILSKRDVEMHAEYDLIISDNGIGISDVIDINNSKTLGMQLITMLVENQLQGQMDIDTSDGTRFHIKFKEINYSGRL